MVWWAARTLSAHRQVHNTIIIVIVIITVNILVINHHDFAVVAVADYRCRCCYYWSRSFSDPGVTGHARVA